MGVIADFTDCIGTYHGGRMRHNITLMLGSLIVSIGYIVSH